jgi:tRNA-splicing ligase RtcB
MRSGLSRKDMQGRMRGLVEALFANIPSGVGSHRKDLKLGRDEQRGVLKKGAKWAVDKAMDRGRAQFGTRGSGNHFVEVGYVSEVFDESVAHTMGLCKDQVTIIVHTGSRGLGHQVCDDYIRVMMDAARKYQIELPDPQLCCAPVSSGEGRQYLEAMACAANFAFANRQMITHWVRETFERVFQKGPKDLQLDLIYDVCHNIAKIETHTVNGEKKRLCVHRKGATRSFPPGHPEIPRVYRTIGQPVLIPGDMGRCSYVLVGDNRAMEETFGSTCHGAGRVLSRHQAIKAAKGRAIGRELEDKGIIVKGASRGTIVEEIPDAYKDVTDVVNVVHHAGISRKVARLIPMGVIKG